MNNVFEETVKLLIKDAKSLQKKFTAFQEKNDLRGALDTMRLLKDTLSLIKEYDWELRVSECKFSDHTIITTWEQNHCGEIRNKNSWTVGNDDKDLWYKLFKYHIQTGKSCIIETHSRNTGKSFSLARLCSEYSGLVLYKNKSRILGIENADRKLNITSPVVLYRQGLVSLPQYKDRIIFIDEGSDLLSDEIEEIKLNHIIIGFR